MAVANPPGAQCPTAGLPWEPGLLSAWSLPAALEARRTWGLAFSSRWTKRGEESGMSVPPSNSALRSGLQLGGRRGMPSLSRSQSSGRGGCEWLPASPRSEHVHRHLGPQSPHFLVDSHVAACVCAGPLFKCLCVSECPLLGAACLRVTPSSISMYLGDGVCVTVCVGCLRWSLCSYHCGVSLYNSYPLGV